MRLLAKPVHDEIVRDRKPSQDNHPTLINDCYVKCKLLYTKRNEVGIEGALFWLMHRVHPSSIAAEEVGIATPKPEPVRAESDRPRDLATELAHSVVPTLQSHLRRRYSLLARDHDDLISETLVGLMEFLRAHEKELPSRDEIAALAMTILKRRVADRFRKTTREIIENMPPHRLPSAVDPNDPDEAHEYRKLLWGVLAVLTELSPSDQMLLMRNEFPNSEAKRPLSEAERQRTSRLRARLRERFKAQFGVSVDEFLKK